VAASNVWITLGGLKPEYLSSCYRNSADRAEVGEYRVNGPRFYTSKLNFDPCGLGVIDFVPREGRVCGFPIRFLGVH